MFKSEVYKDYYICFRKDKWHLIKYGNQNHSAVDFQWENLVMIWLMLKWKGEQFTILDKNGNPSKTITIRNIEIIEEINTAS